METLRGSRSIPLVYVKWSLSSELSVLIPFLQRDDGLVKTTENNSIPSTSPYQAMSVRDSNESNCTSYDTQDVARIENDRDSDRWVSQISVDSQGGVSFHNPTSVFHEAPSPEARLDVLAQVSSGILPGTPGDRGYHQVDQIKQSLVSNAAHQRRLEDLAIGNITAIQSDVLADVAAEFLRFHWCWIHPMFMFVYRPAFTRTCPNTIRHPTSSSNRL